MVTIRVAGPEDAETVERVRGSSWRMAYAGLVSPELISRFTGPEALELRRAWLLAADRRTLVAVVDGVAAGMAAYGPERRSSSGRIELYSLYVDPGHWSAGVGRCLMERVIDDVRAAGADRLSLWVLEGNTRARRFYGPAGFVDTGEFRDDGLLDGVREVRYERVL